MPVVWYNEETEKKKLTCHGDWNIVKINIYIYILMSGNYYMIDKLLTLWMADI